MLDLGIMALLLIGFLVGLRRGLILQLIHLTGFFVAFAVAYMYYGELAPKLKLWVPYPSMGDTSSMQMVFNTIGLETAYYNAISFAIIFFSVKIIWQMLGSMLDFIANLPILKTLNRWAGGIFGFLEIYLIMFILLYIAALLPVDKLQILIQDSFLAEMIIKNTPILSAEVSKLWFGSISL